MELKASIQKADSEAIFKHKMKGLYNYHVLLLNNHSRTFLNCIPFGGRSYSRFRFHNAECRNRKGQFYFILFYFSNSYTGGDSLPFILPIGVRRTQGILQWGCPEGRFSEWRASALTHGVVWWMTLSWATWKQADPLAFCSLHKQAEAREAQVSIGREGMILYLMSYRCSLLTIRGRRQRQKSQIPRITENRITRLTQHWLF